MYFIFVPQKVRFCRSAVRRKVTFSHIASTRAVAAFVRAVAIQELTAADSLSIYLLIYHMFIGMPE